MARMGNNRKNDPPIFRINPFRGINLNSNPTIIHDSQSPDMLNMRIGSQGTLAKRTGYEKLFSTSLGTGKINGMFLFRKKDGTSIFLIAHGNTLYRQEGNNQPVFIDGGLSGQPVNFFTIGDYCYIQDGEELSYYDPVFDGMFDAESNAYIPTLTISRNPSGGGEPYEDFNLITSWFKDSFSGDGTSTVYQMSLTNLSGGLMSAEVNGVGLTEDVDFTVNRAQGKVTFNTAPAAGTNNVIIYASKIISGLKERIFKCKLNVLFGGANDSRVFVSGNPDYPNYMWQSGLYEPTYFPENGFYKVGNDSEKIQGFAKQYDYLVIEKERTKWMMQFELNNGDPSFPIRPINDQVGTYAKNSIQILSNNPVSLNKTGVHMLVASNVRDERNTQHISANIDARLLREPNLDQAISIDFDMKYWLAVNGNVYIYDYEVNEWYIYNNVNASCFVEKDGYLHFGSNTEGLIYRFKKETELNPYNDDGQPINAYWYSKLINFGLPEYTKLVSRIFYALKPGSHTSCSLYIRTDRKGEEFESTSRMDQIDFWSFDFTKFTFMTSDIPQEVAEKVKEKKITHIQLKLENNELDESLEINSLGIKYNVQNEVK
ncbi:hypothetical protein [Metabacillus sp. Hm71]|uniref:hypothetical protein n=1 Tax=Metabacillus sp. Hm71 TaxID=3450743 RepID=UPI003F443C5B